jgi:hypothetical protein
MRICKAASAFSQNKYNSKRNHEFDDAVSAVENAEGSSQAEETLLYWCPNVQNIMIALAEAVKKELLT